jgi:ABC-type multidrug transport system fused ATPase/permease subunit
VLFLFRFFKKKEWFFFAILILLSILQAYIVVDLSSKINEIVKYATNFSSVEKINIIKSISLIISWVIIYVFLLVFTAFLSNYISSKIIFYIRQKIFMHVNRLSLARIEKIGIHGIISRSTNELD